MKDIKEIIGFAFLFFILGLLGGHFFWGAFRVEVHYVEFPVAQEDPKCTAKGGHLAIYAYPLPDPDGYTRFKVECRVDAKTISL